MSAILKQTGGAAAKILGLVVFIFLFLFNLKVAFNEDFSLFGLDFTFVDDVSATICDPDTDGGGIGYGDAGPGYYAQVFMLTYDCGTWYYPLRCPCSRVYCMYDALRYCVPYDDCGD